MTPDDMSLTGIDYFLLLRKPLILCIAVAALLYLLTLQGCQSAPPVLPTATAPTKEQQREPLPFPPFPQPKPSSSTTKTI